MTTEIAEKKWPEFCQRLARECYGCMVSLELAQPDGTRSTVADNVPLLSFTFDDKDACNSRLIIEAGRPDERPVQHVVVEPIHIRMKQATQGDRFNQVHILAENGITVVSLHPGIIPKVLKGLDLMNRTARPVDRAGNPRGPANRQRPMRVSAEVPGAQTPARKAAQRALTKARLNVDVEYAQGEIGRTRRPPAAPRSKRQRRR